MAVRMNHVRLVLKNYLNETSIHGLKYLGSGASLVSRILWTAAIVCCFVAALTSFMQALEDWNEVPLETTIQSISQPIDSIPFPTVTVCSSNSKNKMYNFQRYLFNGLKFACSGEDSDCEDTKPIRKILQPQMRAFLEELYEEKVDYFHRYAKSFNEDDASMLNSVNVFEQGLIVDTKKVIQMMADSSSKELLFNELTNHIGKKNFISKFQSWLSLNEPDMTITQTSDILTMSRQRSLQEILSFIKKSADFGLGDLLHKLDPHYFLSSESLLYDNLMNGVNVSENISFKAVIHRLDNYASLHDNLCGSKLQATSILKEYYEKMCPSLQKYSLSLVMLLSKYKTDHNGFYDSPIRFLAQFNISDSIAGFSLKNGTEDFEWDPYSAIQFCKMTKQTSSQATVNICQRFLPIPTNNGICYAFNALHGFQMVNQSDVFHDTFTKSFQSEYHLYPDTELPLEMASDGKILSFWITDSSFNKTQDHSKEPVEISISDVWNSFDFLSRSLQIEMGTDTVIYVQPMTQVSIGIDHLPLETRKCRFNHEVIRDQLSIFGFYSFESCIQECKIAAIIEICRCMPWNLAYRSKNATQEVPICFESSSMNCVNQIIIESSNIQHCKDNRCLSDCNSINFEVSRIDKSNLPIESECPLSEKSHILISKITSVDFFTEMRFQKNTTPKSFPKEVCESRASQSYSRITVKMASHYFTRFKQTQRVDFHGKISQLGGTMGLFTGMSFLSFLETAFWFFKLLPF